MTKQRLTEEQQQLIIRINEALAHAKTSLNKTKAKVASECDVTAQALNNWLRRGKISRQSLILLAQATQVNPLWLYAGESELSKQNNSLRLNDTDSPNYPNPLDRQLLSLAVKHSLKQVDGKDAEQLTSQIYQHYQQLLSQQKS